MKKSKTKRNDAAVWMPIDELVPWEDNPRKNSKAVEEVRRSIERFGFAAPVVARSEDLRVIAGHTRIKAARQLGLEKIPVRLLDINEKDADLLSLADNKLAEIADWDDAELTKIIRDLDEAGENFEGLGFSEDELKKILGEVQTTIDEDDYSEILEYRVIVLAENEEGQHELVERLEKEGYKCHMLIS